MSIHDIADEVADENASVKLPRTKEGKAALSKIVSMLDKNGIDPDEIGRIEKVRLGEYQVVTKDNEGNTTVHDLEANGIIFTPAWQEGPAWPVVQPAAPVVVKAPRPPAKKRAATLLRDWKTAVILPDPQIGYRQFEGGELDPFHDAAAIDVALQVLGAFEHDRGVDAVVNLGDYLDLPSQSRFAQEPAFAATMQASVNYGHTFLAQQRALAPNAELVLLEGNHDKRMSNYVQANAAAAFGLRQANIPDAWPVMSLPHLLRLDEMDVVFIDAWPTGMYWLNDRLRCMHGDKVRSGGSTAHAMVKANPNIGTIHGHIHRIESHSTTIFERVRGELRPLRSGAYSPGCLCRIDGAVPSMKGSTGVDGRPAKYFEDWQQGVGTVTYTDDGDYFVNLHQIIDGTTVIGGQVFKATVDMRGNPIEQAP